MLSISNLYVETYQIDIGHNKNDLDACLWLDLQGL